MKPTGSIFRRIPPGKKHDAGGQIQWGNDDRDWGHCCCKINDLSPVFRTPVQNWIINFSSWMLPWILREASILFSLGFCIRIVDIISNHFGEHFKGRIIFLKITEYFVFSIYQRRSPSYSCRSSHLILRRCSRRFLAILPKARGLIPKPANVLRKML